VQRLIIMGAWLDSLIVWSLVTASAGFACYRLGPAGMRSWLRRQWARILGKPVPLADDSGANCGGCGSCASTPPRGETRIAADNIRKLERTRSSARHS
jgi:hypothetical protein